MNGDLLTTLRYLAKKRKRSDNPFSLFVDGKIIKSPVDISKAFVDHFFKPALPSSECHKKLIKKIDVILSHPSYLIPPIILYELESAISNLKSTNSAGLDQLSSSLILATHACYDSILLDMLNTQVLFFLQDRRNYHYTKTKEIQL